MLLQSVRTLWESASTLVYYQGTFFLITLKSKTYSQRFRVRLFFRLGLVTSLTFILLFLPFLPPFAPFPAIFDPITRIFPFNRGLFEDKVANFWCASNVALKWKDWASPNVLVKLSAGLTAVGFLPSVVGLIQGSWKNRLTATDKAAALPVTPTLPLLPFALLTSSMSFFLFSFQVHEKTILVPLLPITLILSGSSPESSAFAWCVLANNVGVFRYAVNLYVFWLVLCKLSAACGRCSNEMGWRCRISQHWHCGIG